MIFGNKNVQVYVAGVELYGVIIEFFQFVTPPIEGHKHPSTGFTTAGWKHIAFEVNNIEAEVLELRNKGVDFLFPVQELPHKDKMVYFVDPDGLMLELIQPRREE
jgi:catechol 2,3-dioxygenase-like lactoylglutathione lyase family enzyme